MDVPVGIVFETCSSVVDLFLGVGVTGVGVCTRRIVNDV
jgi:hypothetical protein